MNYKDLQNYLNVLLHKKLIDIYYLPTLGILNNNMFVINFGENNLEYSIHAFSFVRVFYKDTILLTSSDEFFNLDYDELSEIVNDDDKFRQTLIFTRAEKLKIDLRNEYIKELLVKEHGDIIITFTNDYCLEILPDCSQKNYEYYRILKMIKKEEHFIVNCNKDRIIYSLNSDYKQDERSNNK